MPPQEVEINPGRGESMKTGYLLVILLAIWVVVSSAENFHTNTGIDFFQYWGVSKAQQWSRVELNSPYVEEAQYANFLRAWAEGSSDDRLKAVSQGRANFEFSQTPFCYSVFAFLPEDYSLAFGIFQVLQIILFIGAIVILGRTLHWNWTELLSLAFLLSMLYEPLLSDLRVGNLNSGQFFGLTLLTALAQRLPQVPSGFRRLGLSALYLSALVFLTLLKPTLALVTVILTASFWIRQGTASFVRAGLVATAITAVFILVPCIQFHSWGVWLDWSSYVRSFDSTKLLSLLDSGNFAPVFVICKAFDLGVAKGLGLMAAALALSIMGALALAVPPGPTRLRRIGAGAASILRDPFLSTAVGIAAMFALSPLVWTHYYTLALFPALWLLWAGPHYRCAGIAAALSIVLTSGVVQRILFALFGLGPLGELDWLPYYAAGWLFLWTGILAAIAGNQLSRMPDSPPPVHQEA
jgi:hypothetical protein